jgi:hypothetical protein
MAGGLEIDNDTKVRLCSLSVSWMAKWDLWLTRRRCVIILS